MSEELSISVTVVSKNKKVEKSDTGNGVVGEVRSSGTGYVNNISGLIDRDAIEINKCIAAVHRNLFDPDLVAVGVKLNDKSVGSRCVPSQRSV